jgi:HAD superfamily hydrolase (TIGR01549 family)
MVSHVNLVAPFFLLFNLICSSRMLKLRGNVIKAISFEINGTLIRHGNKIEDIYAKLAVSTKLENPPTAEELRPAFALSYSQTLIEYPCYRTDPTKWSSRRWWRQLCKRTLELTNRSYSDVDIDRFFRCVYQHYGSTKGYSVFPDTEDVLQWLHAMNEDIPTIIMGVTSDCSTRSLDTTLPNLNLHDKFHYFTSCQEVGESKPSPLMFSTTFDSIKIWNPEIEKHEVLHIGTNISADYEGAKQFGFQSLYLDRSKRMRDASDSFNDDIIYDFNELRLLLTQ